MRNFWLLATHEYRKMIGKRTFLLSTLGIPLLIFAIMGLSIFLAVRGDDRRPLGYVDQAGILHAEVLPADAAEDTTVDLIPFTDETDAAAALETGDIQAFYVVPADYLQTRRLHLFYWEDAPGSSVRGDFADFIRANLAADEPEALQKLLLDGPDLTVRSADASREIRSDDLLSILLPLAAAMLFFFVVMGSAGYLLQVVTDEKENRTMEVMITSVSPVQLIGGKALGLMAVSMTQLLIWLMVAVIAMMIAARQIPTLPSFSVPWIFLLVITLYFLPAYALMAGLMTAIGGSVTELRQGQQIAGILNLLFIFPFFFVVLIFANPNSPILVALTLFPTTSFITVTMRWSVSVIPVWQLALSWVLLVTTAVLSVYASAKIFRVGMLRYGQSLNLRGVLSAVRNR